MARVFIREKLLSDGKASLILDYVVNGQRRKQTLKIYVDPNDKRSRNPFLRNAYDEAYKRAELVRLDTEKRLINQEHDLPTAYDKRASFLRLLGNDGCHPKPQLDYHPQSCARLQQRTANLWPSDRGMDLCLPAVLAGSGGRRYRPVIRWYCQQLPESGRKAQADTVQPRKER